MPLRPRDDAPTRQRQRRGAETVAPKTFAELNGPAGDNGCRKCGEAATHSMSVNVASLGGERGQMTASVRKVRLCEACAVRIFLAVKKALR